MAGIAKNKIEGFAFIKEIGIIALVPALILLDFFNGLNQYLLAIVPSFWPIKAMLNIALNNQHPSNLPFVIYMLIGVLYFIFLSILSFKFFLKRIR